MLNLVLMILMTYKIVDVVVYDYGPFDLLKKFRTVVGVYHYGAYGRQKTQLGRLFGCVYCLGVWVSAAVVLGGFATGQLNDFTTYEFVKSWGAVAGGQTFLHSLSKKSKK